MKAGWEELEIGQLCEKTATVDPRKKPEEAFTYVDVSSVSNQTFSIENTSELLGSEAPSRARRRIEIEDVIFATIRPTLLRVAQVPEHLDGQECSTGYVVLKPTQQILSRFLFYSMFRAEFSKAMETLQSGASYPAVTDKQVRQQPIPLPPLEEQKRIVAVLDEAFAALDRARTHAETNLKNARELFASLREQKLNASQTGWSIARLEEMIHIKHGFAFKSEFFKSAGDHVLLTPGNYYEDGGYRDRGPKQKYYEGELPEGFVLRKGDMLVAMTEQAPGLLGSCILVPEDDRFLHNQRLGLIQPNANVDWYSPFFAHVFNLTVFRKALSDTCSGIKVRHTSPKKIYDVEVPIPPTMNDQIEIAAYLDNARNDLSDVGRQYENKLSDLDSLRQSLLQKAFAGELS